MIMLDYGAAFPGVAVKWILIALRVAGATKAPLVFHAAILEHACAVGRTQDGLLRVLWTQRRGIIQGCPHQWHLVGHPHGSSVEGVGVEGLSTRARKYMGMR